MFRCLRPASLDMALIPRCHLSTSKSLDRLRALSNKNSSKRWVRLVSASTTACEDEDFGSMMGEFSESDDDEDLEPSWWDDDEDLEPNWSDDDKALEPDAADDGEALEPDAADRCDTSPLDSLLRRTRRCSAALRGATDLALGARRGEPPRARLATRGDAAGGEALERFRLRLRASA
ncbi:unnamed protein product [Prorocentrum cordatum]|uniref:Uncharacterized protein n=1 Tax=Prorocentrum cordatum TaxID=2364126 RepID=A0ABN9SU24_9DINO|nr:unnamed protein product [Polarella glacialis]